MRILLLILQFPPDVNSNGMLMAQVGEELVKRGHDVSVITSFPHYEHFRVWDEYRGQLAARETYQGMNVLRLYVHTRGTKLNMLNRFMSYFSFAFLAAVAGALDANEYDVILCPNGGFLTGIAAAIVSAFKHAPFVLNIQDLYPETPIRTGQIRNPIAIRVLQFLERWMYSRAAHISVITPYFAKYLESLNIPKEKVSVVPNFVDTSFIRPLDKDNSFARDQSLLEKFVVSHAGNVGLAYDLETLIESARLLAEHPEIEFVVVGDGVLRPRLEETAVRLGLRNVRFLGYRPREEVPLLRAASDVQVALSRKGASNHSMPSKVYEIMASGRPLLASADPGSDLWNLVSETQCGLCVPPQDPEALAQAILTLRNHPRLRDEMAHRGRTVAEQRFSRASVVEMYERVLSSAARRKYSSAVAPGPGSRSPGAHTP